MARGKKRNNASRKLLRDTKYGIMLTSQKVNTMSKATELPIIFAGYI